MDFLIDKNLDIHPLGLEENINKTNNGDVLGFSSPYIDVQLEEQGSKCIECILEEAKMYSPYKFVSKEDVLNLLKWLRKTNQIEYIYDDGNEEYNSFVHGFEYNEDDSVSENSTTVRNI